MWDFQAVRQSLSARNCGFFRDKPYPDGRDRYTAYSRREPGKRVSCDSPEGCYVKAIKQLF